MKIAIDFREGAELQRAGKGEYVFEVTRHLPQALPAGHEIILVIESGQTIPPELSNYRTQVFPHWFGLWHILVAAWLTLLRPADLYWASTSVIVPALAWGVPTITTIFDFSAWRFTWHHHRLATIVERVLARVAYRRSRHLLAISEFTKQEANHWLNIPARRITVTPLAVDHASFRPRKLSSSEAQTLRSRYHLPEKFILYLGTLEPRKNLSRLIQAYGMIQDKIVPTKLVLAGVPGWFSESILSRAKQNPNVYLPGHIARSDRPLLYNLADAFAFPSLYEGFGLPPLEAMASGVPVIAGNVASLPEVVGEAGVLVAPKNIDALSLALIEVLVPGHATQLREAGLVRAQLFTWQQTAKLTAQVFTNHDNSN